MNSKGTQPYIYMDPFSTKFLSHPGSLIALSRVPPAIFEQFITFWYFITRHSRTWCFYATEVESTNRDSMAPWFCLMASVSSYMCSRQVNKHLYIYIYIYIYILFVVVVNYSVMSDSLQLHGLYSLPGSSVHGISQARILEWVAIPFSRYKYKYKYIYVYVYVYITS